MSSRLPDRRHTLSDVRAVQLPIGDLEPVAAVLAECPVPVAREVLRRIDAACVALDVRPTASDLEAWARALVPIVEADLGGGGAGGGPAAGQPPPWRGSAGGATYSAAGSTQASAAAGGGEAPRSEGAGARASSGVFDDVDRSRHGWRIAGYVTGGVAAAAAVVVVVLAIITALRIIAPLVIPVVLGVLALTFVFSGGGHRGGGRCLGC